ncbi:MAG: hypothetical protein HY315_00530 [Acidobacteria bacterium]|nr:hypothetical protein [Acidobacteriota bacterium]
MEAVNAQFRFEIFNLFNCANFGIPDLNVYDNRGRANASAGRIRDTSTTSRQIQVGMKFMF